MQLQVQLLKTLSLDTLRAHIDSVKGTKITYSIVERESFYALYVTYESSVAYSDFMQKLHDIWRK